MPEGDILDNLLSKTIVNLLKSIHSIKVCKYEIDIKEKKQRQCNDIEDVPNYGNDSTYDDSIASLNGMIVAFLWIAKAILQRKQIFNSQKTYTWQDGISSLLFTLLTNDDYNATKNSAFVTHINSCLKQSEFPEICHIFSSDSMENNTISHLISDKMSIITSKHSYVLPVQRSNSTRNSFNNFNPFWQQKCWVQFAVPLLKKIIENSRHINSKNSAGKMEFIEKDMIENNNNNEIDINYKAENEDNNETKLSVNNVPRTFPRTCLLGLLHLSKNMPPNILSSQSKELSKVILEELKVTNTPPSVSGKVLLNPQGMESSAGT